MNSLEARALRLVMERDLNDQRPFLVAELAIKAGFTLPHERRTFRKVMDGLQAQGFVVPLEQRSGVVRPTEAARTFLWNQGAKLQKRVVTVTEYIGSP